MEDTRLDGLAGDALLLIAGSLRKLAVFCSVVAVAASIYTLVVKPRYLATAVAAVPGASSTGGLAALTGLLPGALGSLGDLASSLPMEMGTPSGADINVVEAVLSSRSVMERIVIRYDLMNRWHLKTMDDALKKLYKRVGTTLTNEGLFVVTAMGETREEAAAMVSDILRFADEDLSVLVTSRSRRARIEAEQLLAMAVDSLSAAQDRLQRFRTESGLILPEEQGAAMIQAMSQVEAELLLARSELSGTAATLSSSSPAARELAARIGSLERDLASRLGPGDSLSVFPPMDSLPADMRIYENLYLAVQMKTTIVMMLTQQLETLRIEEARESPTLEIIQPPVAPKQRAFPRRTLRVLGITMAAFVLGCLWLTLLAYFRRLARDPSVSDFGGRLKTALRGQIPARFRR